MTEVDIITDLAYGDCGKGKVSNFLASKGNYDYVCRWNGGSNAGHTIYNNGKKFATHLVPAGVFHGVKSVIGPGCVLNVDSFNKEILTLADNGIDVSLIKVFPNCNIVTNEHIEEDKAKYSHLGTTASGIAPAYRDKYGRTGTLAKDVLDPKWIFDGEIKGNVLCEGAQSFYLDIDWGNYPYVTSSHCLPYAACSLGFSPKHIRHILGVVKAYDTKSGEDPDFPDSLLDDPELQKLGAAGHEFGTTTGRQRKCNWLNTRKLVHAARVSGATIVVVNKCDIFDEVGILKFFDLEGKLTQVDWLSEFKEYLDNIVRQECPDVQSIYFSNHPETMDNFLL